MSAPRSVRAAEPLDERLPVDLFFETPNSSVGRRGHFAESWRARKERFEIISSVAEHAALSIRNRNAMLMAKPTMVVIKTLLPNSE